MRTQFSIAIVLCAVAVSGCQSLGRTARVNPAAVSARPTPPQNNCPLTTSLAGDAEFAIDLGCFKFNPGRIVLDTNSKATVTDADADTAYKLATTGLFDDKERVARNRLEGVLINHANTICEKEKGTLYANRAITSAFLDFLSSGLSTASTIVGGEQAKSILSGAAGLSTATRTNVDANVYQNQIVPAITKVMDAERAKILTAMEAKHGTDTKDYPTDQMIRRANEYHQACSFQKGMQLLLDAAVNKEGVDRIIEGINLRTAWKTLQDQRNMLASLKTSEANDKIKEIDKKLGDLTIAIAQNAADASSVTVENSESN